MDFKNHNLNTGLRIALVIILTAAGTLYFISAGFDIYFFVIILMEIIAVISLFRFFNRGNEELATFLSAVINEDSSLIFSENTGNKSFNRLHNAINRLNKQIREAKTDIIVQEKFYKTLVENSSTGLLAFDNKGVIKLANNKSRELLGIKHLHNIRQLQRVNTRLIDIFKEIQPGTDMLQNIIIKESAVHLSLSAAEVKMRDDKIKVIALNDISHEIDKQEIDSWQKLIRILNHEIMNSVAPITSLSSTISGFYKDSGKQKASSEINEKTISNTIKGLEVIEEHGKGLISFVNSYRNLTRLPDLKPKELSVKNIFESVSILVKSLKEENYPELDIKISMSVDPDDLIVCADEDLFTRVVFNLVKNSVEALEETEEPVIELTAETNSTGNVIMRVIDNGPGMNEELLERIFIPFFTTREEGNGIGLSLARQIINMHKGSITVKSAPGTGTTMLIRM